MYAMLNKSFTSLFTVEEPEAATATVADLDIKNKLSHYAISTDRTIEVISNIINIKQITFIVIIMYLPCVFKTCV